MPDQRRDIASTYGDPRVGRTRSLLTSTAADLLVSRGPAAVTFEEVSAASRVARSTLYRHFPDRGALLAAAVAQLLPPVDVPAAGGAVREQLLAVVTEFARYLHDPGVTVALPALFGLDKIEPESRARIAAPHRTAVEVVLEAARSAGELRPGVDITLAPAQLFGPLFFRALVTAEDVDESTAAAVVDLYLEGARQP